MIWTPERIAQARQRNFGESVTLTAQDWDAMLDMAERWRAALEAIAGNSDEDNEWDAVEKLHNNRLTAQRALDGGGGE